LIQVQLKKNPFPCCKAVVEVNTVFQGYDRTVGGRGEDEYEEEEERARRHAVGSTFTLHALTFLGGFSIY